MSETKLMYHEAIRIGAMLKPQGFGDSFDKTIFSCANSAAREAVGDTSNHIWIVFPFSATRGILCPVCVGTALNEMLCGVVAMHLNDLHKWTRNQIADWLEPLELAWWKGKQAAITEANVASEQEVSA